VSVFKFLLGVKLQGGGNLQAGKRYHVQLGVERSLSRDRFVNVTDI